MPDIRSPERFLPVAAVIDRTSFSRATLYQMVHDGDFPRPIRISPNRVAWPESAVTAWIADKIAEAA
jgi:prophage regulatory protein